MSISQSLKSGVSATANASLPMLGGGGTLTASVTEGFSVTSTNASSETVSHTGSQTLTANGDNSDGVDHNQDRFEILLNPAITLQTQGNNVTWTLGTSTEGAFPLSLTVYELNTLLNASAHVADNSYPCPVVSSVWTASEVAECLQLKKLNFTNSDYATILSLNPFVNVTNPATVLANYPNRFIATGWNWPYVSSGGSCTIIDNYSISNTLQSEVSSSYETQYNLGFTLGMKAGAATAANIGISDTQNWTWTNTASVKNTSSNTNSATATLACPSPGFSPPNGDIFLSVYWDTLYGSFLFIPASVPTNQVITRGHVTSASGQSAGQQLVELSYAGKTYRTTTNGRGDYAIYVAGIAPRPGQALRGQLKIGNSVQAIDLESKATTAVHMK